MGPFLRMYWSPWATSADNWRTEMRRSEKDTQEVHRALVPSRRRFLKGVSAGTIATIVTAGHSGFLPEVALAQDQPAHIGKRGASVQLDRSRLPVLRKADVIVIG